MSTNFTDASGETRLVGTIYAPGATPGDVFTVQADGSLSPAPGGGSQPGATRLIDLGVLHSPDLLSGPVTIYTPAQAGELFVLTYDPFTFTEADGTGIFAALIGQSPIPTTLDTYLLKFDPDLGLSAIPDDFHGGATFADFPGAGLNALAPLLPTDDPVVAQFFVSDNDGNTVPITAPFPAWQANHAYAQDAIVLASDGNYYSAANAGTSGNSDPAWDYNNPPITDNDISWGDCFQPPTIGDIHLYAWNGIPAVP